MLETEDKYCCTWRGGGFRDEFKQFFERMTGKFYRVPGFLATSLQRNTAVRFMTRVKKDKRPRLLWCILVSTVDCALLQFAYFNFEITSPNLAWL